MKKKILIWVAVAACVLISIGGIKLKMDNDAKVFHDKMVAVVESKEGKEKLIAGLKKYDKNALTENGIIKSYKVDMKSIKHNPMGGIDGIITINGDADLRFNFNYDRPYEDNALEFGIVGVSKKMNEYLKDNQK